MSQLALQTKQQTPQHAKQQRSAPNAQDSLAACKSLFNGSATRKTLQRMFDSLPNRHRGLVLIAGGLTTSDFSRSFNSFDDLELQKLRSGMKLLKEVIVEFDSKLGDVRRLKHKHFSKTH